MGNCLVTKLKGVVDNPDLLKLNEFRFTAGIFHVDTDVNAEFTVLSDNTWTGGSTSKIATSVSENDLATVKSTKISVINKNDIISILVYLDSNTGADLDISPLAYNTKLTDIDISGHHQRAWGLDGIQKVLKGCTSLTTLKLQHILLIGVPTLEEVFTEVNNTIVNAGVYDMTEGYIHHVPGELSVLAKLTAVTSWNWWNDSLDGNIEDFVAAARSYGRTTGTINVNIHGYTQVKFQGQRVTGKVLPSDPDIVLSWTENTITWDGVTINA